jgi:hypothetical protein
MSADFFLDLLDGQHGPHARVLRQRPSARKMNWAIPFADGSSFLDPECEQWLYQSRAIMRSFMVGDLDARPGPQTVLRIFQGLRKFIQWAHHDGLRSFDGLTIDLCGRYREYVTSRLTFHGVSKRLSGGAIASLLQPLRVIVAYLALTRREFAEEAQTYRDVTEWADTTPEFPTLRIPDEFALPLMQAAISYVSDAGTALTSLYDAVVSSARSSTAQKVGDRGEWRTAIDDGLRKSVATRLSSAANALISRSSPAGSYFDLSGS